MLDLHIEEIVRKGRGYISLIEYLLSVHESLGSIPRTTNGLPLHGTLHPKVATFSHLVIVG